jgi:hypothetical protein
MNRDNKIVIIIGIIAIVGLLVVSLITISTIFNSHTRVVEINGISFEIPLDLVEMEDNNVYNMDIQDGVGFKTFYHVWDGSYLTIMVTNESKIHNSPNSKVVPKKIGGIEGFFYQSGPGSEFTFEYDVESIFIYEFHNKTIKYQTSNHNYEEIFTKISPINIKG